MKYLTHILSLLIISVFLSGCAGSKFVRQSDDALVLGETSYQSIVQKMGKPYREGTVSKNGKMVKTIAYAYASTGGEGAYPGLTAAARSQGFFFLNDKLVGYEFLSSWKEDSTEFDGSKVAQIKEGQTTRKEVEALLGKPGGQYIYPLVAGENEKGISYLYNHTKGTAFNLKFYQKTLVISFRPDAVVSKVEYVENGQI